MDAFATVDDLQNRWRALKPAELEKAQTLLEDAAAFLRAEFKLCGKTIDDEDELLAVNLKVISCAMVKRIMANNFDSDITQTSITAGSFSQQMTFANPTGDFYLRDQERRLLGIPKKKVKMAFIMPGTRPANEG